MKKNNVLKLLLFVFIMIPILVSSQDNSSENKYQSLIQEWLLQNKNKYQFTDQDIKDVRINESYYSKKTNLTHVYLQQTYKGIEIKNAISGIAIKDTSIFYFSNSFVSDIAAKGTNFTPQIQPISAIKNAAVHLKLGEVSDLKMQTSKSKNQYIFSNGKISKKEIPVKLVFQKINNSLQLAWDFSIHSSKTENWYSIRVDAISGEVIDVKNWTLHCDFDNHVKFVPASVKKNRELPKNLFILLGMDHNIMFFLFLLKVPITAAHS